mgnify:CR=1 FL=1
MKTQVIMRRKLFDGEILQQSDTGYFSANELIRHGNKWRILNDLSPVNLQEWLRLEKTKEFVTELKEQIGKDVKMTKRGRNAVTWLHPFLFIDLALYISPKLKVEVYSWLYDELLKYRNSSGDSYKKMTGALWTNCDNKSKYKDHVKDTARKIKTAVGVDDWQTATESELKTRDRIHDNISLLCDVLKNNDDSIRIAILKTLNS